ncbi:hypothetical protein ACWCPI_03385 [Streptomyces sp. NPDC001920]
MGIRTLHRRTAPAPANVNTEDAPAPAGPSVPPFATGASTARIPADLMSILRRAVTTLRRRLTTRTRGWAELTRGYLALARTLLPRPRPVRTVTVFVATAGTVSEPPDGSAPYRPNPYPHHPGPGPDATP